MRNGGNIPDELIDKVLFLRSLGSAALQEWRRTRATVQLACKS